MNWSTLRWIIMVVGKERADMCKRLLAMIVLVAASAWPAVVAGAIDAEATLPPAPTAVSSQSHQPGNSVFFTGPQSPADEREVAHVPSLMQAALSSDVMLVTRAGDPTFARVVRNPAAQCAQAFVSPV